MATSKASTKRNVPELVAGTLEAGRARLEALEKQTQETLRELYERGNRELDQLRAKLPAADLSALEELRERARALEAKTRGRADSIAGEFERRLLELQERLFLLAGLATREQVEALGRKVDALGRKIDRLAKGELGASARRKTAAKPGTRKKTATKKTAKKKTSAKKKAKKKATR